MVAFVSLSVIFLLMIAPLFSSDDNSILKCEHMFVKSFL
jgi:hypothetical protein